MGSEKQYVSPLDISKLTRYQIFLDILGKSLYIYPNEEFPSMLVLNDFFIDPPIVFNSQLGNTGLELLQAWSQEYKENPADSLDALKVDATYLFAGTQTLHSPPWESFYKNKERMIFQKETLEVRNWYKKYGFELRNKSSEPDDHIGIELEFISKVIADITSSNSKQEAIDLLTDVSDFIEKHPLSFVDEWAKRIKQLSQTDFYRGLAYIVPIALNELKQDCINMLDEIK